ncbi:hypothetical protein Tco_0538671 [Tanacetum coccineum]
MEYIVDRTFHPVSGESLELFFVVDGLHFGEYFVLTLFTIYGSDLLILSDYAPSMPPLLSLPLSMACDDSDGCVTMVIVTIYGSDLLILLAYAPSMPPLLSLPLPMACDDSDGASFIDSQPCHSTVNEAVMNRLVLRDEEQGFGKGCLPWLAYSQNRLNSKKVFCSHIDISEPNKLNYEGNDEFIGREEQRQGGLHLGMATY